MGDEIGTWFSSAFLWCFLPPRASIERLKWDNLGDTEFTLRCDGKYDTFNLGDTGYTSLQSKKTRARTSID
jgi:hypothetical protein